MKHFSKSKMSSFSNLSDLCMSVDKGFSPEKLITDIGLYEGVLIDTCDLKVDQDDSRGLEFYSYGVSPDVKMLHKCFNYNGRVMLPCPICKQQQPSDFYMHAYQGKGAMKSTNASQEKNIKMISLSYLNPEDQQDKTRNAFDLPSPMYICGNDILAKFYKQDDLKFSYDKYFNDCVQTCMKGIPEQLGVIRIEFSCMLNDMHKGFADFVIYKAVEEDADLSDEDFYLHFCLVMEKVGQYPSMADLQMFDIEKYQKVMNKEQFHDFKMALGLYASGVGCGSFVYLRRILEQLVSEAATEMSEKNGWETEEFLKRHFNEKIDYVEGFGTKIIPDSLTSVRDKIYGVLSKGVHASSDKECITLFPIMKLIIEELLDHKLERREKEERLKQVKKALEKVK